MALAYRPLIGARNLVYALLTESSDVSGGTPTYGAPVAISNLAKISVNTNGNASFLFGDDAPRMIAETIGKIDLEVTFPDLLPSDYAALLGHTYANGQIVEASSDQSPYVALGFQVLRAGSDAGVLDYDYYWLYKCRFVKPSNTYETKADSVKFNPMVLKAEAAMLIANNAFRMRIRTSDPNVTTAAKTSFFTQVTLPSSDNTALTVTFATGTGAAKTFTVTFAKASASGSIPFSIPASSIAALVANLELAKVAVGTIVAGITAAISSAGTGFSNSPVVVTVTSPNSAAADACIAFIAANSGIVDNNNSPVTPVSGLVTLHA